MQQQKDVGLRKRSSLEIQRRLGLGLFGTKFHRHRQLEPTDRLCVDGRPPVVARADLLFTTLMRTRQGHLQDGRRRGLDEPCGTSLPVRGACRPRS